MKDLIKDTIEKIKQEHIEPDSKWKYLIRKYVMWFLLGMVIFFGAASFSAAYYLLASLDWDLYRFMHSNIISYSFSIFPYLWVALLAIFAMVAFFDIRKTETGYRFSLLKISIITIGGIVVLGLTMSFLGLGNRFNMMMADGVPYYGKHMMVTRESQWSNPENGFLAGKIVSSSDDMMTINDLSGKKWNVILSEKTLIRPRADISVGQMIKIIGNSLNPDSFQATEIRPWRGMGMGGNVSSQSCTSTHEDCPMKKN